MCSNLTIATQGWVLSKFKIRLQQFKKRISGVLALIANDDFSDTSAMLITLESQDKTYRELHDYMTTLKIISVHFRILPICVSMENSRNKIGVYIWPARLSGLQFRCFYLTRRSFGTRIDRHQWFCGWSADRTTYSSDLFTRWRENDSGLSRLSIPILMGMWSDSRYRHHYVEDYRSSIRYRRIMARNASSLGWDERRQQHREVRKERSRLLSAIRNADPCVIPYYDDQMRCGQLTCRFQRAAHCHLWSVNFVIMLLLPIRVASVAASNDPDNDICRLGHFQFAASNWAADVGGTYCHLGMIVDNSIVIIDRYIEKIDQEWVAGMPLHMRPKSFSRPSSVQRWLFP